MHNDIILVGCEPLQYGEGCATVVPVWGADGAAGGQGPLWRAEARARWAEMVITTCFRRGFLLWSTRRASGGGTGPVGRLSGMRMCGAVPRPRTAEVRHLVTTIVTRHTRHAASPCPHLSATPAFRDAMTGRELIVQQAVPIPPPSGDPRGRSRMPGKDSPPLTRR